MAAALMHLKHLHLSAHGPNVRDLSKLGDWKCAERKSFFLQYFLPLFQGLYKTPEDISLVTSGIRAARLHQTRVIDRTAPYDEALRTYDYDDAGEFVTPYANLVVANDEWLRSREAALTNRLAKSGALSMPTTVRSQHLPEMALMWGGNLPGSQWGFEGRIGDEKRRCLSALHPVANMRNNIMDTAVMTLMRLSFDLPDVSPIPNPKLRLAHTSLSKTTLLHPKTPNSKMTTDEDRKSVV